MFTGGRSDHIDTPRLFARGHNCQKEACIEVKVLRSICPL